MTRPPSIILTTAAPVEALTPGQRRIQVAELKRQLIEAKRKLKELEKQREVTMATLNEPVLQAEIAKQRIERQLEALLNS